jgi:uncharacterized membrane protein YgcG
MTTLLFALMMQYIVSTKAGLVNYVQGAANVKATQSVAMGTPIRTGNEGFAEILLNPGSYLRLGQNSEAVLEGLELVNVAVRLNRGTAVIEASGFDKEAPLTVRNKDLKVKIIKDGVYSFSDGEVRIIEGQLVVDGKKSSYKKGWVVSATEAHKAQKEELLAIELWSRNRSKLIAAASENIVNSLRRSSSPPSLSYVWLWDPTFGAFTFIPGYRYRNPYGYRYRSLEQPYYNAGYSDGGGSGRSGGFGGGNSGGSSGSNAASSGGGGGGMSISTPAAVSSQAPSVSQSPNPPAASPGQRAQP